MLKYLLDTNICIYIAKHRPQSVLYKFESLSVGSVGMSIVTFAELRYGALKSQSNNKSLAILDELTALIPIVEFNPQVPVYYSEIRAFLEKKGQPIGNNDLWIAAHAMAIDKVLVSNNTREFERIEELRLENWVD